MCHYFFERRAMYKFFSELCNNIRNYGGGVNCSSYDVFGLRGLAKLAILNLSASL